MSILPWRSADESDKTPRWVDDDVAVYGDDGTMNCPRCEYADPSVSSVAGRRSLECIRCGYKGQLRDGVYLFTGEDGMTHDPD